MFRGSRRRLRSCPATPRGSSSRLSTSTHLTSTIVLSPLPHSISPRQSLPPFQLISGSPYSALNTLHFPHRIRTDYTCTFVHLYGIPINADCSELVAAGKKRYLFVIDQHFQKNVVVVQLPQKTQVI